MGEHHLKTVLAAPAERAFWWPRFRKLAAWFVKTENDRRAAGTRLLASESEGEVRLGPLTVQARADRIDEVGPGGWEIIDYKTGRVPSPRELEKLFAPQLLLEAVIAGHGRFDKVKGPPEEVHLSYWQANGLGEGGAVKEVKGSDELVLQMMALVKRMAEHFANPATAYEPSLWPEFGPHFNDYAHLERTAEWSSTGGARE